jgi:hypothetical protein
LEPVENVLTQVETWFNDGSVSKLDHPMGALRGHAENERGSDDGDVEKKQ